MSADTNTAHATTASLASTTAGSHLTSSPVRLLSLDGIVELVKIHPMVESLTRLGLPARLSVGIGILDVAGSIAQLVPGTLVGRVLLPICFAVPLCAGLLLRSVRLRATNPGSPSKK